eukprot:COSAG06_NODE_5250_length_3611_cov_1.496583_5_plen_154_part_00
MAPEKRRFRTEKRKRGGTRQRPLGQTGSPLRLSVYIIRKNITLSSVFSVCVPSRACLGKTIFFSIKWRKRFAFSYLRACLAGAAPVHTRAIKLFQLLTDGQLAVPVAVDVARQAKEAAARIREILAPAQHVIVPHVRGRGGVGVVAAAPEHVE